MAWWDCTKTKQNKECFLGGPVGLYHRQLMHPLHHASRINTQQFLALNVAMMPRQSVVLACAACFADVSRLRLGALVVVLGHTPKTCDARVAVLGNLTSSLSADDGATQSGLNFNNF
jgi:hypothetical protein